MMNRRVRILQKADRLERGADKNAMQLKRYSLLPSPKSEKPAVWTREGECAACKQYM